jgi:NAD(P)-dependent dehydrogenase (short-subunit alcohol dehydrogenase family)
MRPDLHGETDMNRLADRLVVLTGAGGNLGRAVGLRLVAEGARVFALERRKEALASVLEAFGPTAAGAVVDLEIDAQVEAAFEEATGRSGPLWGLVHTAGTWQGGKSLAETTGETFELMLSVNLRSTFVVTRAAVRRLEAAKGGRIVTIGAITAHEGKGMAGSLAYNTSKAAVITLTKGIAEEGRAHGIFANVIAPGTMDTPQNRAAVPEADPSRWAKLEEVADAIAGLLSPESAVTGAVLPVPGRG